MNRKGGGYCLSKVAQLDTYVTVVNAQEFFNNFEAMVPKKTMYPCQNY